MVELTDFVHPRAHIGEEQINDCDGCHCLNHNDGTRNNDRVMAAGYGERDIFPIFIYRLLFTRNRRGRLYGSAEKDSASVAHASKRAACVVGKFGKGSVFIVTERVVICTSV